MKKDILKRRSELFPERSILCGFRGSIAHNTYVPSTDPDSIDDIDLIGVYLAPVEHYIGLGRNKDHRHGTQIAVDKYDCVHYELKHFINLLLKSNPTTMLLLWLNETHYLEIHEFGKRIVDNRHLFVSKYAYKSFTRYAEDQIERMQPSAYLGYMGAKRKALVDKYGYDCKNAAHSIRLLKMVIEYLNTGCLNIFRTNDSRMLVSIKTGGWSLSAVKEEAYRLMKIAEKAYETSQLPDVPCETAIESLLMGILSDYIYEEYYADIIRKK